MKSSTKLIRFASLVVALLFVIYVGAYLLSVHRVVGDSYGKDPSSPTYHYVVVGADPGRGLARRLFMPVLKIDRDYIRHRYWEGWYVVKTPSGTKKVYEDDMRAYMAKHAK